MLLFLICVVVVTYSTNILIVSLTKNGLRTDRQRETAAMASIIGISAGLALYLVASFHLSPQGLDIWDYSELNKDGIMNILCQIVGAVTMVEHIVLTAFLLVEELKRTWNEGSKANTEKAPEEKLRTETVASMPAQSSPMPQGKIPAWKQVEMDNANK